MIYEIEKIKDRRKKKEKGENGGREENIWENKSKICPKNCEKFTDMLHVPKKCEKIATFIRKKRHASCARKVMKKLLLCLVH